MTMGLSMRRILSPAWRPHVDSEAVSPDRWAEGRVLLRAADPRMAALVDARPAFDPDAFFDTWPSDLWSALVGQVIGQQISLSAAAAILGRLRALHGDELPTPAQLLAIDDATLRGVGLSHAKTVYIRDLAARLADGRLDLERLRSLDDDAARSELTQINGVGRFTADGVLLLTLRRQDIWPAADLALRRAVARVWELEGAPSLADVDAIGERFRPWRTLGAVYLLTDAPRSAAADSALATIAPRSRAERRAARMK
jgi:DNA-3-methyladenine glycosylase II